MPLIPQPTYSSAPEDLNATKSGRYEIDELNRIYDKETGRQLSEQEAFGQLGLNTKFLPKKGASTSFNYLSGVTATDPATKFNLAVLDMLTRAQSSGGNVDLFKQQRALQRASIERESAITPEEQRILSPSQQSAIRSGRMAALEPEIDAVASEIKARDSRLQNFESILGQVREIGGELIKNIAPPQEVLDGYKFMIRAGANPTSIPEEIRNKVMANMTPDDWNTWKAENKKASTGGININTDNERALLSQFRSEKNVVLYNEVLNKKLSVDRILESGVGGPGDLAVVYEFMKALDPNSVVRETEYATAAKSGNIFAGVFARFNGYLKEEGGFLPENVKKAFQSIVNSKLSVAEQMYNNVYQEYRDIAKRQGLNPDNVTINYGKGSENPNIPKSKADAQPLLEDDIQSLSASMTREQLADELFKDYGKWYTRDEIYRIVLQKIPDKPVVNHYNESMNNQFIGPITSFLRK